MECAFRWFVVANYITERWHWGSIRISKLTRVLAHAAAVDGSHTGKQETGLLHRYVCRPTVHMPFSFCIFIQFSVGVRNKCRKLRGADDRTVTDLQMFDSILFLYGTRLFITLFTKSRNRTLC